jgi:hypothetical protein
LDSSISKRVQIEFDSQPIQTCLPNKLKFDNEKMKAVDEQVQELLQKGAIVKTEFSSDKFIFNIFLEQKKNGKLLPVINLRKLNQYVEYHHFKQENL